MGGRTGAVLSSVAGDGLGVHSFDPFDLSAEALADRDRESGVAVVLFVSLWAPIKHISVVPHPFFQSFDTVLEGGND